MIGEKNDVRVGQRVRVREGNTGDFAGQQGVIVYVGDKACDVKIAYKPHGSFLTDTYIGTFRYDDLEF